MDARKATGRAASRVGGPPLSRRRWLAHVGTAAGLLVLGYAATTFLLPFPLDLGEAADLKSLCKARLPGYGMAMLVGGALGLAGLVFQVLVHNPLASPYILGISAGGSLGAVLAIYLGLEVQLFGIVSNLPVFALAGCVGAIALVLGLARRSGRAARGTMLLAGVVVNASLSAVILFITYVAREKQTLRIVRWLMGGISEPVPGVELATLALVLLVVAILLVRRSSQLNVLALSDEEAASLGVAVESTRRNLFLAAAVLTAAAVSFTGPIGFVGLIVPHVFRLLLGSDHRLLVPVTVLGGGLFLVVAEGLAHTLLYPARMPVGILTALLGGPFFLILLRRRFGQALYP